MIYPSPIALVVCDNVYRERGGKTALVGLFNSLVAAKLPCTHPKIVVYASVTDVRPNTVFRLEIVNAETDAFVTEMKGPPPAGTDPTTICDFLFELRNVTFPTAGRYYIRFWAGEHLLLQRPFEVSEAAPKG